MDETVSTNFLRRMINELEANDVDEVSFVFIVGSCFPEIYDNIMEEIRAQYTAGYIAGREDRPMKSEYLS